MSLDFEGLNFKEYLACQIRHDACLGLNQQAVRYWRDMPDLLNVEREISLNLIKISRNDILQVLK